MPCPEINNPILPPRCVELSRYSLLHPEGRQLISGWFQRAWQVKNCREDEVFEPFIFVWFAFNGWAACVTDTDRGREIIDSLAADTQINNDFTQVIKNNQDVSASVGHFFELLPIFDVKTLRQRGILRNESENRRERVNYYLSHGAREFEPKCWQRHQDAGEVIPVDWGHLINAVYKVRAIYFTA